MQPIHSKKRSRLSLQIKTGLEGSEEVEPLTESDLEAVTGGKLTDNQIQFGKTKTCSWQ